MKIWIDGYEANVPQRLGSSQIGFEILKGLEQLDRKNDYTILLPSAPMNDLPNERGGWKYKVLRPKRLWTRIALPLALFTARSKPDLLFSPTHYIPRFSPVKRVVTIFDLSYLHFPEMYKKDDLFKLTNWTKYSVSNAVHIVTISNSSKQDLMKYYSVKKEKITVAYPGYDKNIFRPLKDRERILEVIEKYGIHGRYIIYIGTIQPRKNLVRLIEAFQKLEGIKLVIVGKTSGQGRQGWMFESTLKAPKKFGVEDRVIFTGFAPTEDLPYLLNGAEAFILPALYEGFGITAVEAMACGTPAIVSNVSSMPEAVGSAGLLINPQSVTQIEQAIRAISGDCKLRAKKSAESIKQAEKFSWGKMTKTVLRVFESVAGQ
ncbi:hypothetical protein A3A14_04560 [Candidatus Daviesbacteria bacterium RIFCSPLOWO2_01_FULL_43_38]|uniref:Glycosyl transferase family 1 domain-containing protein n=2 Tax=Candidatus Daviesiibacteriota TaxID=1752718 RepID=A0A1F5K095_9BACT|nr:MAG: Glycosyl transferase group 1 [Candidatus Daviesbacteria bacterium GW2011_GWA2_42_7]OGE34293.1 MAG: hypothetical protein A3E45_04905 [Candidatus Daviesbacteria bacterium RIFCSPHIGHO2_12_FULL_43_11]OGE63803.1 MAG: hypothetical protein A3A14_04560 [Candidatus Daviesbacteria bacterium RIFCSPLOWO2_01_FULL_43_38]OGE69100.1 MAG: hypothetical protein A3J21_00610 [Candidatus Daviesbacteria bacterium RIFCSPLOWO2_02_FULL_43_11]